MQLSTANSSFRTQRGYRWGVERERALLFRELATLRTDIPLFDLIDDLRWKGPTASFAALGARFDAAITQTERSPRRGLAT